ncbi:MAG: tRNA (adenosine(37)-N6)-threonylcarbamoyltransferase complex ATPase subunit type 1 TsaE [Moraxella sp.]
MNIILKNDQDTANFAKQLANLNLTGTIWLVGDLGAGKTTLTRYFLQSLGHEGAVKSPTYTLVEPYLIAQKPVYHADLYRLEDPEELDFIGFFDYLNEPNSLMIIEWASRAKNRLPKPNLIITISCLPDGTRLLQLDGLAESGLDLNV